jgi:sugar lactone lactonase YvrE
MDKSPATPAMEALHALCLLRLGLCLGAALAGARAHAQLDYATPYTITTLAGVAPGSRDGLGTLARFNGPSGLALDAAGNLYVSDTFNDTIRKISPTGEVTTLAGAVGETGSADGLGKSAQFFLPWGVAVDGANNVYVADNYTIRKITPAGFVTTLAGKADQYGAADGTGETARLGAPQGVAADAVGNVYVADIGNGTIRMVTASGVVTTIAGSPGQSGSTDGPGTTALFESPDSIALDSSGNLYVCDEQADTIRKLTPTRSGGVAGWSVSTLAGLPNTSGSSDGVGSAARFFEPSWLAADREGNIYVADMGNDTVRRITPDGSTTTLAGAVGQTGSVDGAGAAARFSFVSGMAVNGAGVVFVADEGNETIRAISQSGVVSTLAGSPSLGSTDGQGTAALFAFPSGVAVDDAGNLYVVELGNSTLRKISPSGDVSTLAGTASKPGSLDGTGPAAEFSGPEGVALDPFGNIFVADTGNQTIRLVTPGGAVVTVAGQPGIMGSADGIGGAAQFNNPVSVAVDASGNVYVADSGNDTIRKITPAAEVSTLAGIAGQAGYADGTGGTAQFNYPAGVAVDGAGNIYVADWHNHLLRKISPAGQVTTLAGAAGQYGHVDGMGSAAQFGGPAGIAVDSAGNILVADGSLVRKVTPGGSVTTLAGDPGSSGEVDGTGSSATFGLLVGLAVDRSGVIYCVDQNSNTIRKGVLAFSSQPVSQTVDSGSYFVVAVAPAGNAGLQYQWQLNGVNLADGNGISGATGPQLVLSGAQAANGGTYVCVVSGPGIVAKSSPATLVVEDSSAPGKLANRSGRAFVGTKDHILINGFTITGTTSATVLIQAIGPTLGESPYKIPGVLQHPILTLHQTQNGKDVLLYSSAGWGSNPVLLDAAATVYANPVFRPGSGDSELLVTLPPGGYTAEVSGADGGTGVVLFAVYQLP